MENQQSFWRWQERALGGLLAWGVASAVVGAGLLRTRSVVVRHAGQQALVWGLIDLLLALNGRRSARRQVAVTDAAATISAAIRFRTILVVNAALDVGYVAGGTGLARRSPQHPDRRGTGLGIALQGLFLLVYDLLLLRGLARWTREA